MVDQSYHLRHLGHKREEGTHVQFLWSCLIVVTFPVSVMKYSDKRNLRSFSGSQFKVQSIVVRVKVAEA